MPKKTKHSMKKKTHGDGEQKQEQKKWDVQSWLKAIGDCDDYKGIERALMQRAAINGRFAPMRLTPMMLLLQHPAQSREARLTYMIGKGADFQLANASGTTALMLAVMAEDARSVQILLKYGAHVNAQDQLGCTALHQAMFNCYRSKPLPEGAGDDVVADDESQSKYIILNALLENGAHLGVKGCNGHTPKDLAGDSNNALVQGIVRRVSTSAKQVAAPRSSVRRHDIFSSSPAVAPAVDTAATSGIDDLDFFFRAIKQARPF